MNSFARKFVGWLAIAVALGLFVAACARGDSGAGKTYTRDHVDRIEVNHLVDSAGDIQLDQVIFWDYCPSRGCFQVRAWRTLKDRSQVPYRVSRDGYFRTHFHDIRDGNMPREITADSAVETWTTFDPESVNGAEVLDRNCRRELSLPPMLRARKGRK